MTPATPRRPPFAQWDRPPVATPGRPPCPDTPDDSFHPRTTEADAIADHLTGRAMRAPEVPWFWTVQHGVRLQRAGVLHPDDAVVLRGDPGDGAFCVVYLREGRLVAIDTVGSLADFRTAKKLIARGAEVDPHLVADPAFTLVDAATLASTPATV